jgi:hypothetical protein
MIYKRIVLLANSRKNSGRCLAGIEIHNERYCGWIRPVSARVGKELSEHEREFENGTDPQVLDIIDVPLDHANPYACQVENWLIDEKYYWIKVGAWNWQQASMLAENPATLWINDESTYNGLHDQIAQNAAAVLPSSICLIKVDTVDIHVLVPGATFGNHKKRVQARFKFNGVDYWLWITDPNIERAYLSGSQANAHFGKCLLTVSLSEPHEKEKKPGVFYRYKLVAAILPQP